jgi:hypothetical protein
MEESVVSTLAKSQQSSAELRNQRVEQTVLAMRGPGLCDHAGRLVGDDDRLVLVDDLET